MNTRELKIEIGMIEKRLENYQQLLTQEKNIFKQWIKRHIKKPETVFLIIFSLYLTRHHWKNIRFSFLKKLTLLRLAPYLYKNLIK